MNQSPFLSKFSGTVRIIKCSKHLLCGPKGSARGVSLQSSQPPEGMAPASFLTDRWAVEACQPGHLVSS